MTIKVLTLFPGMFPPVLNESVLGRAIQNGILSVECIDIRAHTLDKHRRVDDAPFGGGAGQVMTVQPIADAMAFATDGFPAHRIFLSPRGATLTQKRARELAQLPNLVLLCGHYEGVDQRAIDLCIDEELSIGDYVLTGGELPALVLIDCLARLLPGTLGNQDSAQDESFETGLLEYPHYTRPAVYDGIPVPEVLLNGHHAHITAWRREQALKITRERRPDLLGEDEG